MSQLKRYWFIFDFQNYPFIPIGTRLGCGITAINKEDAISLLKELVFRNEDIPLIYRCIENVDIQTLDQNHVVPNMSSIFKRGIWFPTGY